MEDESVRLHSGMVVDSGRASYTVLGLIGEGGFGAVYKVRDTADTNKIYALKLEAKLKTRKDSKLKMEIAILKTVAHERAEKSHFTAIVDRGKKERFYFIVMQLVGKSLADLKNLRAHRVFSIGTGLGASMQCLEAVEDLHKHGYIHRDIKPSNFAVGLEEKCRIVYILDFGIARKFINDKGLLKAPREAANFKGTVRYASIACHRRFELAPKDDCESWFYLFLDLIIIGGLPWQSLAEKDAVLEKKEESRSMRERLFRGVECKKELGIILDYIDNRRYEDRVDYAFIYATIQLCAKVCNVDLNEAYDWEEQVRANRFKASEVCR